LWQAVVQRKDGLFLSFQRALTEMNQQRIVDQYLTPADYAKSTELHVSPRECVGYSVQP